MVMKTWFVLLAVLFADVSYQEGPPLFERTDPQATGVTFANQLQETERENVLAFEYFYNGGGVAAGDLNNCSLVDLPFTSNQSANKLNVNKGKLTFTDASCARSRKWVSRSSSV